MESKYKIKTPRFFEILALYPEGDTYRVTEGSFELCSFDKDQAAQLYALLDAVLSEGEKQRYEVKRHETN